MPATRELAPSRACNRRLSGLKEQAPPGAMSACRLEPIRRLLQRCPQEGNPRWRDHHRFDELATDVHLHEGHPRHVPRLEEVDHRLLPPLYIHGIELSAGLARLESFEQRPDLWRGSAASAAHLIVRPFDDKNVIARRGQAMSTKQRDVVFWRSEAFH